jgi:uncharacterized membrane protein YkoI
MDSNKRSPVTKLLAVGAVVVGLAAGSYGVAAAATSGSSSGTTPTAALQSAPSAANQQPWGGQRSDETVLTGDALSKVKAIALAKVSGGTISRIETDADGNAAYEAHMVRSDGTPVTVYVDSNFNFVSVESG